jgi:hypothetical protein
MREVSYALGGGKDNSKPVNTKESEALISKLIEVFTDFMNSTGGTKLNNFSKPTTNIINVQNDKNKPSGVNSLKASHDQFASKGRF